MSAATVFTVTNGVLFKGFPMVARNDRILYITPKGSKRRNPAAVRSCGVRAAVALLLASVGLYTMVAHSATQRTQEIGIRMAVGGSARDILGLVLRQGMLPLAIGLVIGLAASLAVNRVLKSTLIQIPPDDPITLAASSAVLILAAMLACAIPAWRAMKVDPVVALRNE
jgi:putative ABC transport system permease protein